MIVTPRSRRIASASGVVGPLAPSAISLALTRAALRAVIWPSMAAGTRMSQSSSNRSSLEMRSVRGVPTMLPVSWRWRRASERSMPSRPVDAALASRRWRSTWAPGLGQEARGRLAHVAEALDRDPGAAQVQLQRLGRLLDAVDQRRGRWRPGGPRSRRWRSACRSRRPAPSTPGASRSVSMIQAIVWALVFRSGAGMSLSGPIRIEISVA